MSRDHGADRSAEGGIKMGIDMYLQWDGQTEAERQEQYTGYSTVHGHVGYLREAYHGGPYATKVLASESWDAEIGDDEDNPIGARIPAPVLRSRLKAAIVACKERALKNYNEVLNDESPHVRSIIAFVELAERKEAEGKNPRVYCSY